MDERPDSSRREADRLIYAGLLGLAAAGVIQMVDKGEVDFPQTIGVYSFALAIPLLAVGLVTDYARRAGTFVPVWRDVLGIVGAASAVVGLGALFFHFGNGVGVVFALGCAVGFVLIRRL